MRTGKLHCGLSAFYKYCRLLSITRPRNPGKPAYQPLRAGAPLTMLHLDVTLFKTLDGVRHYIYVVRDNFSRAILACRASLAYSSEVARETLAAALQEHGLMDKPGQLITDGGAENKGSLKEWLSRTGMLWRHLIAQVDIVQSNSMVEAANKIIKQSLYTQVIANGEALLAALPDIRMGYNDRPCGVLYGLTPNEVLVGQLPDKRQFREQIAEAKRRRVIANQQVACVDSC